MKKTPRERRLERALKKLCAMILFGADNELTTNDKKMLAVIQHALSPPKPMPIDQSSKRIVELREEHRKYHPRG